MVAINSDTKSGGDFSDIKPKPDINMVVNDKMLKDHSSNKDDVSEISKRKL